ncbi:DUF1857 family protein [Pseudomaricurvus alkylphenolicus]|uniref:SRPBCC family protein n=1 Tax=Pseudomaricurvus alkylphenolicus TaxID=1306991 RepID=UPI001424A5D2|nr:SRPBCC family protein [Pseudomaricurvus alkylphenolicus]NIB40851.1 DUF1857 family protein [Pseudomaricurvus alkylphenolicus]
MIRVSRNIPINSPDEAIVLSRSQVWQGLQMKASNAVPFVPSITECRVVEQWDGGILREVVHAGERLQEAITQIPERVIHFRRISDKTPGDIFNELYYNDDGELTMTFTFALDIADVEPGSPEAQKLSQELEQSYLQSVQATLKHLRVLAKQGEI